MDERDYKAMNDELKREDMEKDFKQNLKKAIRQAKPNMDKIKNIDEHIDKIKGMDAREFYEKFKKDKGLNFCEGLDDVFELMTEYSKQLQKELKEANDRNIVFLNELKSHINSGTSKNDLKTLINQQIKL